MYNLMQGVDALDFALYFVVANLAFDAYPTIAPPKYGEGISQNNGVVPWGDKLRRALCCGGCHALYTL